MNVYIATRFDWYHQAALARHLLTEAGHHVTSRWIDEAARLDGVCAAVPIGDPRRAANARMDLDDLEAAEAILVLVPPEGGCGMWLELGYALALGKRVLMVGPARERTIFAEVAGVEVYGRLNEAVEALRETVTRSYAPDYLDPDADLCGAELIAAERRLVPVEAQCGLPVGHDGPCEVRR
jgi:hypothetical protein